MIKIRNYKLINKVKVLGIVLPLLLITLSMKVWADTQYLTTEQFLTEHLTSEIPKPSTLWLVKDLVKPAKKILGHAPYQLRQRYWQQGNKTAWILEEIGKVEFITAGFVVEDGKIAQVRVLTYRESRGGEVRYSAFLKQYFGAVLKENNFLSQHIDGISGATLSVRSMTRMARLALYYDALSKQKE
ncbi:MAG: FMN-binding protein [Methylophilaceae bacterium]